MYERYTGVLSYAFMQDYIITHCKSNHMASLLTKEISYYLSEVIPYNTLYVFHVFLKCVAIL
ncbi:hypothetical protein EON65_37375 [archaeon]|nr:MAG: hypothetical protein EON65_37375 [archaeon]